MQKSERRSGQYVLMSLHAVDHYACGTDLSGNRCWGPLSHPDLQTFPSEEALDTLPEEGVVFVEILNKSPDFPKTAGLGRNDAILEKDYQIWAPRCGELFYSPMSEKSLNDSARLIGLHIDDRDFYFRLQTASGEVFFLSMAIAIEPLCENVSLEAYQEVENEFLANGTCAPETFLVTREIEKPWPRATSPAAYVHIFGQSEHLHFGPFTDSEHLRDFKLKASEAEGFGVTIAWSDNINKLPGFHNTCLPADFFERKGEKIEGNDDIETIENLFISIDAALAETDKDAPTWVSMS